MTRKKTLLSNLFYLLKNKILCPMFSIKINGISVEMPYKPYAAQIITISKLLTSFKNGESALIESPTGTGKSFSIICSILAYLKSQQGQSGQISKIFICSRTHSQINQLVEQLRRTVYHPKMTILGSKTQYCINKSIAGSADKNTACLELVRSGKCVYYGGKDKLMARVTDKIFDIEEVRKLGRSCVGCPYFATRGMVEDAELVFAPYNYLVDAKIRESLNVSLENAIIIIDEAHNIEDVCRTAGSLELTSKLVDILRSELLSAINASKTLVQAKSDFTKIYEIFSKLNNAAEKMDENNIVSDSSGGSANKIRQIVDCNGNSKKDLIYGSNISFNKLEKDELNKGLVRIRKGKEIIEEFKDLKIPISEIKEMGNALLRIQLDDEAKGLLSLNSIRLIEDVVGVFKIIEGGADSYVYCFQKNKTISSGRSYNNLDGIWYTYNLWLLDPGITFKPVVSVARAVCLLSGTLTPFQAFGSELRHTFTHQVVAPHILKKEQVFIGAVKNGHLNKELCGKYAVVESEEYILQVVHIIKDIAKKLRGSGGVLVFVPSYAFIDKISGRLQDAVIEPRSGNTKFQVAVKKYQDAVKLKKTAIFVCVYRGKASEGLNFQDEYARAVIAVGIPFPSVKDPQIALKKDYNDRNSLKFTGRMWYEAQAFRAINQAVGRIIRHSTDWGAVFLIDSRFLEKRCRTLLSGWVSANLKTYDTYEDIKKDFNAFLSDNELIN